MHIKSSVSVKKENNEREESTWPRDLLLEGQKEAEFLCEVVGARHLAASAARGEIFCIDLRVVDGPNPTMVGVLTNWFFKRPLQYTTWRDPANPKRKFTAEQKEVADDERIQIAFAACVGLERDDAGKLAEGESHEGSFEKCFGSAFDGEDNPADIIGRKVINRVYTRKGGYVNNELKPVAAKMVVKAAPKAAPLLPGKAVTKPSLEDVLAAKGFEIHPSDDSYVFNAATDEVVELAEFKRLNGF